MRLRILKASMLVLVAFAVIAIPTNSATTAQVVQRLPNPILNFLGQEPSRVGSKNFIRYNYEVFNREAYPNELFAPSPELPPCGNNTNAARTWVTIHDQQGKRLNAFCALGNHDNLNGIWFALESDVIPPSYVYVEFEDRKTSIKYKSNLADSTQ